MSLPLRAVLCLAALHLPSAVTTQSPASTRVTDLEQLACTSSERYPFRSHSDYILAELDLKPGDKVVDIGAGDGWWSERLAKLVGESGVVHAAEVEQKLVDRMRRRFTDTPQVKPYLCKTDSTELPENSCDLVFVAQTYHHFDADGRVEYLKGLKKVLEPTGRLCVIERHLGIASRAREHGTHPASLVETAEAAGWVLARYELIPRSYHYLAIFVQRELFPPEPPRRSRRRRRDVDERPPVAVIRKSG